MREAYLLAVDLLSRREHGAHELLVKLKTKGCDELEAALAIEKCQAQGFQSDERFAHSLTRRRLQQGYGPFRIQQELAHVKVEPHWVEKALLVEGGDWVQRAKGVVKKKYRLEKPANDKDRLQWKKFLLYRGFSQTSIAQLMDDLEHEIET